MLLLRQDLPASTFLRVVFLLQMLSVVSYVP
jgi:hypothetical protein